MSTLLHVIMPDSKGLFQRAAADSPGPWKYFEQKGCSLRMLCPHAHLRNVWQLLLDLEGAFGYVAVRLPVRIRKLVRHA